MSSNSQPVDTIDHNVDDHCTDIDSQVVHPSRMSTRSKTRPAWWHDYNIKVPKVSTLQTIGSQALVSQHISDNHVVEPKH